MTTRFTEPQPESPLRRNLLEAYDQLSRSIAGGTRIDHRDMLPGADDPAEGLIPEEFRSDVMDLSDWFDPSAWIGLGADDIPRTDLASIPRPGGEPTLGNGGDFFRTGEAPSNFANRHNPLYVARKDFALAIAPRIGEMFGVTGHAGHYREPKASDAAAGGRSANSDHYSAGAIDFFGSVDQLDALRDYLIDQPWISFVRWRSESHGGASGTEEGAHLHASFDLGWIAQHYFQGREVPAITQTPPATASREPQDVPREPTEPEPPTIGTPPPVTAGRPS